MGGDKDTNGEPNDTSTIRELGSSRYSTHNYYKVGKKAKSPKKGTKPKSKSMIKPKHKEETGKQILARIMREIYASIERKERKSKN
jgi:hypothetical protein